MPSRPALICCDRCSTFAASTDRVTAIAAGWHPMARKGGKTAWLCPTHKPDPTAKRGAQTTPCAPCRFTHDRAVVPIDLGPRESICVNCGRPEKRYPGADDSLDDYAVTVARFPR